MKKCLIAAASAFAAFALNADVMNWQVNDSTLGDYTQAVLYYTDSNTTSGGHQLATTELDEGVGDAYTGENAISMNQFAGSENSTWFYIEVGNYGSDNQFRAEKVMGAYSYSDLLSAGLISSGAMNPPSGSTFGQSGVTINSQPASYGAVPEPSSAMLILLGLAVAGLKRRRA